MTENNKIKYTYKQIWLITFPILISLLMEMMIGVTDTAFLGRVGEVELGASAISGVFYMIIFMVAFGFSIGAQILIARRDQAKGYCTYYPSFPVSYESNNYHSCRGKYAPVSDVVHP